MSTTKLTTEELEAWIDSAHDYLGELLDSGAHPDDINYMKSKLNSYRRELSRRLANNDRATSSTAIHR